MPLFRVQSDSPAGAALLALLLLLTVALYGCSGDSPGTAAANPGTQPSPQTPTTPASPGPSQSQLFLSDGSPTPAPGCAPTPSGARGSFCTSNPIPPNTNVRHFIYQNEPADWVATLSQPMAGGSQYGITIELAAPPRQTFTGTAELIVRKPTGMETVLFRSSTFTVSSDTFAPFTFAGEGVAADALPGDRLILRVRCLSSACQSQGLGLLLAAGHPGSISVPQTMLQF